MYRFLDAGILSLLVVVLPLVALARVLVSRTAVLRRYLVGSTLWWFWGRLSLYALERGAARSALELGLVGAGVVLALGLFYTCAAKALRRTGRGRESATWGIAMAAGFVAPFVFPAALLFSLVIPPVFTVKFFGRLSPAVQQSPASPPVAG